MAYYRQILGLSIVSHIKNSKYFSYMVYPRGLAIMLANLEIQE